MTWKYCSHWYLKTRGLKDIWYFQKSWDMIRCNLKKDLVQFDICLSQFYTIWYWLESQQLPFCRSLDERPARLSRQRGLERGGSHDLEHGDRQTLPQLNHIFVDASTAALWTPFLSLSYMSRMELTSRLTSSNQEITRHNLDRHQSMVIKIIMTSVWWKITY